MTTQNNIFVPTLKFSQTTSVSNVNVSNDFSRLSSAGIPYVLKLDSTAVCGRAQHIIVI